MQYLSRLNALCEVPRYSGRLLVQDRDRIHQVAVSDICCDWNFELRCNLYEIAFRVDYDAFIIAIAGDPRIADYFYPG